MKSPKHIICTMLCFGLFYFSYCQNLVPSSSFEDTISCPNSMGQIEKTVNGDIVDAITLNDFINPQNNFEQNQKTVNQIHLNKLSNGNIGYDAIQTQTLTTIAMQEVLDAGLAIYDARRMLNINKDIIVPQPNNNRTSQNKQTECIGTNLLGNASFEDTVKCPKPMIEIGDITNSEGWSSPNFADADYFHTCGEAEGGGINNAWGTQNPITGNAYAGIQTFNWSGVFETGIDYLQHQLLDTLQAGQKYCVSFYASLAENSAYNCNNMGVYFSNDFVYTADILLPFTPQVSNDVSNSLADKVNWTLIQGSITATGGEKYLILGNFTPLADADTSAVGGLNPYAYYYIDDISVVLDTTTVGMDELSASGVKFNLYPNPNNGNMMLDYSLQTNEKGKIIIYDLTGKLITSYHLDNNNNQLTINNEQLNNGIYFYHIIVNNTVIKSDKLVIIK